MLAARKYRLARLTYLVNAPGFVKLAPSLPFTAFLPLQLPNLGLKPFEQLGGRFLIALDGVEFFCSQKLDCKRCSRRKRSSGKTDNFHSMLSAAIVAPRHNMVLPLMPEFITPQDGAEERDCERNGAKRRLINAHAERMAGLRPIYLGDALFCCQPLAEAVLAKGADFIFVCKPDGHKTLYEYLKGVELEAFTTTVRKPGKHTLSYRYRWINGVPLRDGKASTPSPTAGNPSGKAPEKEAANEQNSSAVCTTPPQSCSSRTGKISLNPLHDKKLRPLRLLVVHGELFDPEQPLEI